MILKFPIERPIFIREFGTATYGSLPYFLSKTMVELPMSFLQSLITFLVTYWLMDLKVWFCFIKFIKFVR